MYTFAVSVAIDAAPERVWRALCDPTEVVQWDTGVAAALDAPADYPQPGQHVRWRYVNGPFHVLHDRPQDVVHARRLRSLLTVGPFRFDETYTIDPDDPDGGGCRLTAAMEVHTPLGVLGWLIDRIYMGPRTQTAVAASLQAIKRHCEALAVGGGQSHLGRG